MVFRIEDCKDTEVIRRRAHYDLPPSAENGSMFTLYMGRLSVEIMFLTFQADMDLGNWSKSWQVHSTSDCETYF